MADKIIADFFGSFFVIQEGLVVNLKPRDGNVEDKEANGGAEKQGNGY